MAQSRFSSNNPDVHDLAMVMEAFESQNGIRMVLSIELVGTTRGIDLLLGATAFDQMEYQGVRPTLASVNVKCFATNLKTLEAAVIHVMYLLDGKLAYQEMASAEVKNT